MAASSAAPNTAAAIVTGAGPADNSIQTIFGSHVFRIDGFSRTKDLGVGESIDSSPFRVGGHEWYIRCYPCGKNKESDGLVTLCFLLVHPRAGPDDEFEAHCVATLIMDHVGDTAYCDDGLGYFSIEDGSCPISVMKREALEPLLKGDSFQVRCDVCIPIVTPPDMATETVAGSLVLTVDRYSKTAGAFAVGEGISTYSLVVEGHVWCIIFYPNGKGEEVNECLAATLCFSPYVGGGANDVVKARFNLTLLTLAGEMVTSSRNFYTFSATNDTYDFRLLETMEPMSSPLLADGFHLRCDIAVVDGITAVRPLSDDLHRHLGDLLESQVGGDVTFEVGDEQFTAHRIVLAARSTVFMAQLFGPMKEKISTRIRIDGMEARVFKAMLHFIYTDSMPKMDKDNKVMMAQHLLVAADRYNLERLKLICEDILHAYIDRNIASTTLVLAEQHGCHRLKEACFRFLKLPGNLKAVMAGDGFEHLKSSCPSLIDELLAMLAP